MWNQGVPPHQGMDGCEKTVIHKRTKAAVDMVLEGLFAPRRDHKGMSTPSNAARLWLPMCLLSVAYWSWGVTEGNLVVWLCLTTFIVTPVLSVGWYLIGMVSNRYEPKYLIGKAEQAYLNRLARKNQQTH